ncbi:unnamed protein product [Cladocopium goreaui]|uniref:Dihydroxyacetone kinase (DHA kinase) (Glyceron e kinase) n=1 Tax=Cladocopium goreaui TaxID=2562237 RepID=A0A9P1CYV8_9DINO|nr:unnamed protein product [Cladocopium goreaui]
MYTYDEAFTYYRSLRYKPEVINAYWDHEMLPAKTAKRVPAAKAPRAAKAAPEAKSKAKPKEKPKAKAKATPEPKAKGKAKAKAKAKTKVAGPANPKRFINDEGSIVQDSVDGLIWSTENLARLDGYPDIKVVYRTDWSKDKVALISGGGAGHEPMHGGFVGQGLLTAAISGETFASPSIDAVLAAIVQVTGPKGCLLVIKNYTGDRLNFTLAAQKARSIYGLQVETVIVKDDVATSAERGICGTLFVHKVAGAMSEEGKSLADIKTQVEQVIRDSVSLGVSMSVVRRLKAESIGLKKMEVGLGIHGEPGARTEAMASAKAIVEMLMEGLAQGRSSKGLPEPTDGLICMINNLGGVPPQEMCILVAELMRSKWGSSVKLLIGPAFLCTSLETWNRRMVQPGEQWWPVTVRLGLLARFLKSMGSDFRQRLGYRPTRQVGIWSATASELHVTRDLAAERPDSSLLHRSCPWGGHLVRLDLRNIRVMGAPEIASNVLVRPEVRSRYSGVLEKGVYRDVMSSEILKTFNPGDALIEQFYTMPALRLPALLFGDFSVLESLYGPSSRGFLGRQKLRRDFPEQGHSTYIFEDRFGRAQEYLLTARREHQSQNIFHFVCIFSTPEDKWYDWFSPFFFLLMDEAHRVVQGYMNRPGIQELRQADEQFYITLALRNFNRGPPLLPSDE